jgi:hypothetical protein
MGEIIENAHTHPFWAGVTKMAVRLQQAVSLLRLHSLFETFA